MPISIMPPSFQPVQARFQASKRFSPRDSFSDLMPGGGRKQETSDKSQPGDMVGILLKLIGINTGKPLSPAQANQKAWGVDKALVRDVREAIKETNRSGHPPGVAGTDDGIRFYDVKGKKSLGTVQKSGSGLVITAGAAEGHKIYMVDGSDQVASVSYLKKGRLVIGGYGFFGTDRRAVNKLMSQCLAAYKAGKVQPYRD